MLYNTYIHTSTEAFSLCVKMASLSTLSEKGKEKETENGKPSEDSAKQKVKKEGLGWIEWMMGWFYLAYEMLFQRIIASNLPNPMPLPPINDLTFVVTGSTSGIGKEIARFSPFLFCLFQLVNVFSNYSYFICYWIHA